MFQNNNQNIKTCEIIMFISLISVFINVIFDIMIKHNNTTYFFGNIMYVISGLFLSISIFMWFYLIGLDNDKQIKEVTIKEEQVDHTQFHHYK